MAIISIFSRILIPLMLKKICGLHLTMQRKLPFAIGSVLSLTLLLINCSPDKKIVEDVGSQDAVKVDSQDTVKQVLSSAAWKERVAGDSVTESESDCVFNDDYQGVTAEWLEKLNKEDFIWREDLKQALIPMGQDTVFISKGGCDHFGSLVKLKITGDSHSIQDSVFWIQKALMLAKEYEMGHYADMIEKGHVKIGGSSETRVWFEIEDDDLDDNQYYNGIEVVVKGREKQIELSQYYN